MAEISVNNNEYQIQMLFKNWCDKQDFIIKHWHVPNGMTGSAKQGMFMKRIGMLKGVWDYWLIIDKPALICIEFKDNKGQLSKEQKEFENALEFAKIPHKVCRSPFEATQFVKEVRGNE